MTEEQKSYIREHYTTTPNAELIRHLGLSKSTIAHYAISLGLHKAYKYRNGTKCTPERKARIGAAHKELYRKERARLTMGLPQKTKLLVSISEESILRATTAGNAARNRGYIRVGRTELGYTTKPPRMNKYNLTYTDMRSKAPILIFRGRDKDGDKYEGVLVPTPDGLQISWSEDGETYSSEILVPESIEHVRTEYIQIKYPLK